MKELLIILFIFIPYSSVIGQSTYGVCNVKSDDSLNMRSGPNHQSTIVMKLPYDAMGIRKVGIDESWVQIEFDNRTGWVNGKYLKESNSTFAEKLLCFGNEPYWRIDFLDGLIVYKNPNNVRRRFRIDTLQESANQTNVWHILATDEHGNELVIFLLKEDCSDGMSDKNHTYKLLISDELNEKILNGCCNANKD